MRYADTLLSGGEIVVRRARQHWLALVVEGRLGLVLMVLGVVLLALIAVGPFQARQARDVLSLVALAVLVVGLVFFLFHAWGWWAQDYLITNRRILKVEGIINKRSADSSLEKINDAVLEQDIFGRLLGYGDLDILTAADAAVDRYRMLDRAPQFKREMLDQKYQLEREFAGGLPSPPLRTRGPVDLNGEPVEPTFLRRRSDAPDAEDETSPPLDSPSPAPPAPPPGASPSDPRAVTELLARLADLRDRGAISADDYEAKKQQLLDRL